MTPIRHFHCAACGQNRTISESDEGVLTVDPAGARVVLGEPEDGMGSRPPIWVGCDDCTNELLAEQEARS